MLIRRIAPPHHDDDDDPEKGWAKVFPVVVVAALVPAPMGNLAVRTRLAQFTILSLEASLSGSAEFKF